MKISVQLEAAMSAPSAVRYSWNTRTDVLSAQVASEAPTGLTIESCASVDLEGRDGSWFILELVDGRIVGLEVAAWPKVHRLAEVTAPSDVGDARVLVPKLWARTASRPLVIRGRVMAEADPSEQNFHFRLGNSLADRTVRIAENLLLDVDKESHITGLWLLNVPPFSVES